MRNKKMIVEISTRIHKLLKNYPNFSVKISSHQEKNIVFQKMPKKWKNIKEHLFFNVGLVFLIIFLSSILLLSAPDDNAKIGFSYAYPLNKNARIDTGLNDDYPDIVSDGKGTWVAAWSGTNPDSTSDYDIFISHYTDVANVWSIPIRIFTPSKQSRPSIDTDGKGNWIIVFSNGLTSMDNSFCRRIVACSSGNLYDWYVRTIKFGSPSTFLRNPKVATDQNGTWIVVWESNNRYLTYNDTGTDYDLFAAYSTNNGRTWSAPEVVNTNAYSDTKDDLSASLVWTGAPNDWIVAWKGGNGIYWSRRAFGSTKWHSPTLLPGSYWGKHPSVTTDRNCRAEILPSFLPSTFSGITAISIPTLRYHIGSLGFAWVNHIRQSFPSLWRRNGEIVTLGRKCTLGKQIWPPNVICVRYKWNEPVKHMYYGYWPSRPIIHADKSGKWVLLFPDPDNGSYIIKSSFDYGKTWSNGSFPTDGNRFGWPSMATDGLGKWMAVWSSTNTLSDNIGTDRDILVTEAIPPRVVSIQRGGYANPTFNYEVGFMVYFSKSVIGVTRDDFELETSESISGASIDRISSTTGLRYSIIVNRGNGTGTIKLNLRDNDSIKDSWGYSLGGLGPDNGDFTNGGFYTIDEPPKVESITLEDPNITFADTVHFMVNFSENVTGVNIDGTNPDFEIDSDIHDVHISGISGSGNNYIVTVDTGSDEATGYIKIKVIDNGSIRDVLGQPLEGWNLRNGDFTETPAYYIDKTPPSSTNALVESITGMYTISDTTLNFKWQNFTEDTDFNPISDYQVFLSTNNSPPDDDDWRSIGNETQYIFDTTNSTIPFPEVEHWCWVRAVNSLGLKSDPVNSSVIINTTSILFGGSILEFEGLNWDQVDWDQTILPLTKHAIKIDQASHLITGDIGNFDIHWFFTYDYNDDGTVDQNDNLKKTYNCSSQTLKTPMIIYHTHVQETEGTAGLIQTGTLTIDLNSVPEVIIHYNSIISEDTSKSERLWLSGRNVLQAQMGQQESDKRRLVILQYKNEEREHFGIEIVEVKPDQPDANSQLVDIGSRLLPYQLVNPEVAAEPFVRRGRDEYIYQHSVNGSLHKGMLWSIKRNNQGENPAYNMEAIWMRKGLYDITWPFEIRRYTSNWPTNSNKYQLYVRGNELNNLGPSVEIPESLYPRLQNYEEFQSPSHHAHLNNNIFNADGPGWALLMYQTGPSDAPGLDWVGFEVIRCVSRDDSILFGSSDVSWDIGKEIIDSYHQGPKAGYIHASEGNKYALTIYKDTGQIFPVNKDILEVWWFNLSRTTDPEGSHWPDWPSEKIQWPSKVVRYDSIWPIEPTDPEDWNNSREMGKIIIARQNGSGVIDPEIYGNDWDIYNQPDPLIPGFNPNDEHAFKVQSGGWRIYALRDDLGTPDTSEPYV